MQHGRGRRPRVLAGRGDCRNGLQRRARAALAAILIAAEVDERHLYVVKALGARDDRPGQGLPRLPQDRPGGDFGKEVEYLTFPLHLASVADGPRVGAGVVQQTRRFPIGTSVGRAGQVSRTSEPGPEVRAPPAHRRGLALPKGRGCPFPALLSSRTMRPPTDRAADGESTIARETSWIRRQSYAGLIEYRGLSRSRSIGRLSRGR